MTLSLTVQPGAQAADCEDIRSAISEGGEFDTSAASFCTSTATPKMQAELLDMAVRYRQGHIALELLEVGSEKLISPELMHRAALFEQPQVIKILLQKKPELIEAKDNSGWTPLTSAALGRAYMAATLLLENGASENIGQSLEVAVGRSREIAYLIIAPQLDGR